MEQHRHSQRPAQRVATEPRRTSHKMPVPPAAAPSVQRRSSRKSDDQQSGGRQKTADKLESSKSEDEAKGQSHHQHYHRPKPRTTTFEENTAGIIARAEQIRMTSGLQPGQSIPEALMEGCKHVADVLQRSMTPDPGMETTDGYTPSNFGLDHREQDEREKAVMRIQKKFRGKQQRMADTDAPVKTSCKRVGWEPFDLKLPISELVDQLVTNANEIEQNLIDADSSINRYMYGDSQVVPRGHAEQSERTLQEAEISERDVERKLKGAKIKTADNVHDCQDVGLAMIEAGNKALKKRRELQSVLEKESHLVLDDVALKSLQEKKEYVKSLGNRLVDIRANQDVTSPIEKQMAQHVEEIQADIRDKEGEMETLQKWLENIDRSTKNLDQTLEYLEKPGSLPPEEGILETIQEVKGAVRRNMVEPSMTKQDLENAEHLKRMDSSEVTKLEEESNGLQDTLDKITSAMRLLPDTKFHEEKLETRLGQICGSFDTTSGILEPNPLPNIAKATLPGLRDSMVAQLQLLQNSLKPGLTQLSRFETILQNAQQSLAFLDSHRTVVIDHVKSLKDTLVSETMAVDTTPENAPAGVVLAGKSQEKQEERWRQTILAFHEVEDKLVGGIEEIEAPSNFSKALVEEGLSYTDKVRRYCDRNRWETQDCLKHCRVDRDSPDQAAAPLVAFPQSQSKLIEGAFTVRHRKWYEELASQTAAGAEAAKHAREVKAATDAIAAEVEAQAAVEQLAANDTDDEDEEVVVANKVGVKFAATSSLQSEQSRHSSSSSSSAVANKDYFKELQRAGTPPSGQDGKDKKSLTGIVKAKLMVNTKVKKSVQTPQTPKTPKTKGKAAKNKKDGANLRSSLASAAVLSKKGSKLHLGPLESSEAEVNEESNDDGLAFVAQPSVNSETAEPIASSRNISGSKNSAAGHDRPLPTLPPPAQNARDIMGLHRIALDLARDAQEGSETCRNLARRLGGHPLDPQRNHILKGSDEDKSKIKTLMESLIEGRRAWHHDRQSLSLYGKASSNTRDNARESFEITCDNLRRVANNDVTWLKDMAARKLQGIVRPFLERIRGEHKKEAQARAILRLQSVARGWNTRKSVALLPSELKAAIRIQKNLRGVRVRLQARRQNYAVMKATLRIQMMFRRNRVRKIQAPAIVIQRHIRGHLARKLVQQLLEAKRATQAATELLGILKLPSTDAMNSSRQSSRKSTTHKRASYSNSHSRSGSKEKPKRHVDKKRSTRLSSKHEAPPVVEPEADSSFELQRRLSVVSSLDSCPPDENRMEAHQRRSSGALFPPDGATSPSYSAASTPRLSTTDDSQEPHDNLPLAHRRGSKKPSDCKKKGRRDSQPASRRASSGSKQKNVSGGEHNDGHSKRGTKQRPGSHANSKEEPHRKHEDDADDDPFSSALMMDAPEVLIFEAQDGELERQMSYQSSGCEDAELASSSEPLKKSTED